MGTDDTTARVTAAYTALAGRWDTSGAGWNRPVAAGLIAEAGLGPGMHVLDIGCGAGAATIPAAAAVTPGGHVTGIDLAKPMLDRVRQHAASEGLDNISVRHADACAPAFPDASFDAILASLVVYLLRDPAAATSRWRPLLRPAGRVAFSWVLGEDPAWEPVYDAVDAFLPAGQRTWRATWRRWSLAADAEAILGDEYGSVTTVAEPIVTRYTSPAHWWESSWTQGPPWPGSTSPRRRATRHKTRRSRE
jgi:ubiquinone/menaquinone biosynthesis C-methylase UbiE